MFSTKTISLAAMLAAATLGSAARATTYQVCPDGSGHYTTIRAAINAAQTGDTIILCSGTFTGPDNRDLDYGGKGITIQSATGNPEDCIIDCEGQGRGFLFQNNEELDSVLRGVTIANGRAPNMGIHNLGGGVVCGIEITFPLPSSRPGSPLIVNCIFTDNTAASGGGLACIADSHPAVVDCVFVGNSATGGLMVTNRLGGGAYSLYSAPTFMRCVFDGNSAAAMLAGRVTGGGLYCESGPGQLRDPEIRECVFTRNSARMGGGLSVYQAHPIVRQCTFAWNTATTAGGGVYLYGNFCNPVLESCTLYGNSAGQGGGVLATTMANPSLSQSIIAMGSEGEAVTCHMSATVTIADCDVYGNAGGPGDVASQIGSSGNFVADPGFCGPSDDDFTIRAESPCAPLNHPQLLLIGAHGVWCSGPLTFTVCPTGAADFATIQAGINACFDGDIVELCDATFSGTGNRDLDYGGKAITVRSASGNPAACIIDAGGTANNPHRGFLFNSGETAASVLEGVTITGGYITQWYGGGAVWCDQGSSPTIRNCVLADNHSEEAGGGMACTYGSSPAIEDCVFSGNTSVSHGGGLVCSWDSPLHVVNSTFSGNAAEDDGGGMAAFSYVELEDCTFVENTTLVHGGGMTLMAGAGGSLLLRCVFSHNAAQVPPWAAGGGISSFAENVRMDSCTINGNTAFTQGGGVLCEPMTLFTNCTLYGNSAPTGGGIFGSGLADNTIIAGSGAGSAVVGALTITCCDVFGNTGGPGSVGPQIGLGGNIALDPIFCDAPNEDFTIRNDSPCAPFSPPNPQCDLIGAWPVSCAAPCPEDVNGDNVVNVFDLLAVLAAWGNTGGPADINGDGIVNVFDLLALLAAWGPCP